MKNIFVKDSEGVFKNCICSYFQATLIFKKNILNDSKCNFSNKIQYPLAIDILGNSFKNIHFKGCRNPWKQNVLGQDSLEVLQKLFSSVDFCGNMLLKSTTGFIAKCP